MNAKAWSLEIVRGRETGRVYALQPGETTLGNALNGDRGIDLAAQEGEGPRRMAARHAVVSQSTSGLSVRDLDSPGGTFVNRQRILAGQSKPLQPGDLIQLGGVQLKVVERLDAPAARPQSPPPLSKPQSPSPSTKPQAPPPQAKPQAAAVKPKAVAPVPVAAPAPSPAIASAKPVPSSEPKAPVTSPIALPVPFVLASGATCKTWDDFLTISAQRWPALRDELTSGRLATFLRSIHRPVPHSAGTPDEQLDAWLGTLATSRLAEPEVDVHPQKVIIKASAGGGVTRQTIKLTNTGYRLLRAKVRPSDRDAGWIKIEPAYAHSGFVVLEQADVPFEVEIPESLDSPRVGTLLVESNGGNRQVEVRIERPAAVGLPDFGPTEEVSTGTSVGDYLAHLPFHLRIVLGIFAGVLIRALVFASTLIGNPGTTLLQPAIVFATLGAGFAALLALKRGTGGDVLTSGFAGGCVGVFAAALTIASCRAVEPMLGAALSSSPIVLELLWAALGAGLASFSMLLVPYRTNVEPLS